MFNFFFVDLQVAFTLAAPAAAELSFLTSSNFIFVYLLFLSLTPVAYISVSDASASYREHLGFVLSIYLASMLFLLSNNLFLFIFFYEMAILPIFFVLRKFGHYYRRTQAAFLILIWALLGSFFLFLGLIGFAYFGAYDLSSTPVVTPAVASVLGFLLCLGFLVKVPMWPFHFWISRAHAEGPTNLSIFLSGVLVKLSIFGVLRILDFLLLKQTFFIFFFCALVGVVDSTLKMLIQVDSKVVVAFSTTVQMNFALFTLFTMSEGSYTTLYLALLNHMLTASLLFFIADTILVRFNTRELFFLSGLYSYLPLFSLFLLVALVNQINFPGFLGFVLDLNFLVSVLTAYPVTSFFLFFFLFGIEHLYVLYFFLKICFGVSNKYSYVVLKDLSLAETLLFTYLLSLSIFWGLFPGTLSSLYYLIHFKTIERAQTRRPPVQRLKGKVLSLASPMANAIQLKKETPTVGWASLVLQSRTVGLWFSLLCRGASTALRVGAVHRVASSSRVLATAAGSFCLASTQVGGPLRLPSGALLAFQGVRQVALGRATSRDWVPYKASSYSVVSRKLSVRGSTKNAKDHYNGGKGTGGFRRFV